MKEGWKYKKIKDVGEVIGGTTPSTSNPAFWDGDICWISPAELHGEHYLYDSVKKITKEAVAAKNLKQLPIGTVILSSRAPIGKLAINKVPMYCNQGFKCIVCGDELYNEYLYWWLYGKKDYLNSLGTGATFPEISKTVVENIVIPIAPIDEQHSIVSRLDAAFARIDALKANAERQLAEARALFNRALTEEMIPKEGWEKKTLGDVGTFMRGINFLKNDFVKEGFPCIHYGQIHTKLGVKTYKHLTCIPQNIVRMDKLASKGDIIIAITSEDVEASCKCTAWLGDYDIAVGAHAAIYKHKLNPAFVSYYMKSAIFQKEKEQYVHGFKVMEIRPYDIAKISIAFPSETAQHSIVTRLDALSANVRKLEEVQRKTLLECDALKQAMLIEIFE